MATKPPEPPFLASRPGGFGRVTLLGLPLDRTESCRPGVGAAPGRIRVVSDWIESYSPVLDRDLAELDFVDRGDVALEGLALEAALEACAAEVAEVARHGLALLLGGEHTASLAGYSGVKAVHPGAWLVQLDAHLDIRERYLDGSPLTHATWVYRAGERFGFERIVQLGVRSGDRVEWQTARRCGYASMELALPAVLRQRIGRDPVYVTIDIDVLDPAHAPGTGCPEPGGVTFRELQAFLHSLAGLNVVALDVMEVSPPTDPADITALAAAKLVREAALLFGR